MPRRPRDQPNRQRPMNDDVRMARLNAQIQQVQSLARLRQDLLERLDRLGWTNLLSSQQAAILEAAPSAALTQQQLTNLEEAYTKLERRVSHYEDCWRGERLRRRLFELVRAAPQLAVRLDDLQRSAVTAPLQPTILPEHLPTRMARLQSVLAIARELGFLS